MKQLLAITFTMTFILSAFASTAKAECKFWAQKNFQGQEGGTVNSNDYVRFFKESESDGLPLEVREAKAPVYYGETPINTVKSIKLSAGCEAIVYTDISMNSAMTVFKSDTADSNTSLKGKAASLFCRCKK